MGSEGRSEAGRKAGQWVFDRKDNPIDDLIRPACASVSTVLLLVGTVLFAVVFLTVILSRYTPFHSKDLFLYAAMWVEGAWFAWRPIRCYQQNSRLPRWR